MLNGYKCLLTDWSEEPDVCLHCQFKTNIDCRLQRLDFKSIVKLQIYEL
jgi:hypothetical protein